MTDVLRASRVCVIDCAVGRIEAGRVGEIDSYEYLGVGGHRGFLGSTIGLEILSLFPNESSWGDLEDGPFPLIDSVSLDHENDREVLVEDIFLIGELGGVISPRGMSWSASLRDRLSLRMASFSSMAAG